MTAPHGMMAALRQIAQPSIQADWRDHTRRVCPIPDYTAAERAQFDADGARLRAQAEARDHHDWSGLWEGVNDEDMAEDDREHRSVVMGEVEHVIRALAWAMVVFTIAGFAIAGLVQ